MKKIKFLVTLAVAWPLLTCSQAFAGPFTITPDKTSYGNLPTSLQTEIEAVLSTLETNVNKDLPDADAKYPERMANAGVIANRGGGVDYISNPSIFVLGAGVGLGLDLGSKSLSDVISGDVDENSIPGFHTQTTLMAGINLGLLPLPSLGPIDLSRLKVFVNFMSMDIPEFSKDLSGDLFNFGVNFQYKLVEGINLVQLVKWVGLDVTTGFNLASMDLRFTKKFNRSQTKTLTHPESNQELETVANFTGTAVVGADVDVTTIPVEISTGIHLLYVFSFFGGLGMDLSFGSAKSIANLTGDITLDSTPDSDIDNVRATAKLDLGTEGSPDFATFRGFVGTQLNLSLVKLLLQVNKSIGGDAIGLNLGLRVAW